ncbi:uncharacterized protein LOC116422295 [Sarcophilus harrisii]|uniref:Uncharacterized protein n=1 Tax=Sarcophilus harrisii TaxID=9305 RepID=A0A7N4PN80_SARHA|nr:uncharacterized protein LOC116422295 [Sarcophilus harrisii]
MYSQRKISNRPMGRRQKTLSNASSSKAPVQFSQKGLHRQSKMVLLPCYSHPSMNEETLSRTKPYQSKAKLSMNPRCKTTTIPSSCHKEATTILLPRIEPEVILPHLETQATIMPSPQLKNWGKTTVITSPCSEYWTTPFFGLNHWAQAPLIPDPLFKTSSGLDHLPKIPQGCHNRCEAQPLLTSWSTTPSFPDPNTRITAPYAQNTHYQVKVTTEALPCLNPQPSLSSRHWDWDTTSQFRCLNQRQKIEAIPFSNSDNHPKITTLLSSQSSHQLRPITMPSEYSPVPLAPMAMTLLTPIPNHQARMTTVQPSHDSDWFKTTSMSLQCPNRHLTETPLISHYNWVKETFKSSKLANQECTFSPGPYNLAKVLLVSDQQVKSSVVPEHPAEVLLNYWVTHQPNPSQKLFMPPNPRHISNFTVDLNQQPKTLSDTSCQHEPIPVPDNETKKLLDMEHFETPEIHVDHSDEISLGLNHKETFSPTSFSQPEAASRISDMGEAIPDSDHQGEKERNLDDRTKIILDSNHQVKASPKSDDWVQPKQDSEHQATLSLSLSQTAKGEKIPDYQDQPSPVSNQLEQTTPVSDHGTTSSSSDHLPEAYPVAEHQDILRLNPDHQDVYRNTFPTDMKQKSEDVLNFENHHTLFPGSDHQTTPLNLKDQVKVMLNPHCPAESISFGFNYKPQESQREPSKSFKQSINAIEGDGTISREFFNSIINSIPREKIKNDIQKQILLRRMRGYHNTQPDSHLSTRYTICLACASWIPYGCPHVNGMKDPHGAQLVVMPSPMKTSKGEMGIKYILQVPQSNTGNIWDSSHFSPAASSSYPYTMPFTSQIHHQLPKRMTWLDFILAKGDQLCGRKRSGYKQFKGKMSMNFSTPMKGGSRNEEVVRSLLDRLKNKRTAH